MAEPQYPYPDGTPPLTQESLRKMMGADEPAPEQAAPVRHGDRVPVPRRELPIQPQPSFQAGLAAYSGGAARSLPSVPAPGEPGSRFNPVVRERPAQPERPLDEANRVQSFEEWQASQAAVSEASKSHEGEGVVVAAANGFVNGAVGAGRRNLSQRNPSRSQIGIDGTPKKAPALHSTPEPYRFGGFSQPDLGDLSGSSREEMIETLNRRRQGEAESTARTEEINKQSHAAGLYGAPNENLRFYNQEQTRGTNDFERQLVAAGFIPLRPDLPTKGMDMQRQRYEIAMLRQGVSPESGQPVPGLENSTFNVRGYDASGVPTPEGEAEFERHAITYGQAQDAAKSKLSERFAKHPELRDVGTGTSVEQRHPELFRDDSAHDQQVGDDGLSR